MGIDTNFYPLGSCTMKLNPRVNEWCASFPGFTRTHPLAPDDAVQGNLQIIYELVRVALSNLRDGRRIPFAECRSARGICRTTDDRRLSQAAR